MRVLISGAGVAGPTLAWFLAKASAHVTVVEKSNALLPHGQNVDITGSAVKVIKKMGLLDQVKRFNTTEKGTQFIDPRGRPFAPFPVLEGSAVSFSSEYEILRGDLAALLYEATKDHPNVTYLFNTGIAQVLSNDSSSSSSSTVKVQLRNGDVQAYDLLVAADGQWSKVRKQCFPPEAVNVVDLGLTAVYWTIPRQADDNDWWNVYLAPQSRTLTLRPDPHGTMRAMVTRMPCNDAQKRAWADAAKSDRQTQEELLRREFADAGWQASRLLDSVANAPDFYFHVIQQVKMSRWSQSRVVCLGDAAYAPSPLTGMGTSLAITGAYVLAGELSKLGDGEHPAPALEAYEKAFRPFVEESQGIPFFVPGIAHPETAWKRWLVHALVAVLSRIVAIPWVVGRLSGFGEDDFLLPEYPRLDGEEGLK